MFCIGFILPCYLMLYFASFPHFFSAWFSTKILWSFWKIPVLWVLTKKMANLGGQRREDTNIIPQGHPNDHHSCSLWAWWTNYDGHWVLHLSLLRKDVLLRCGKCISQLPLALSSSRTTWALERWLTYILTLFRPHTSTNCGRGNVCSSLPNKGQLGRLLQCLNFIWVT